MKTTSGKEQIARLNRRMFQLIKSFPEARGELVDFHIKSEFENYLSAIEHTSGQTLYITAQNAHQLKTAIRPLVLLSDTVVFNVTSYIGTGKISFFPIRDSLRSPVLGLNSVLDANSKRARPPKPVEMAYVLSVLGSRALDSGKPEGILGIEWIPGTPGWQQSDFTRTSEQFTNKSRQKCHIVAGLSHVEIPDGDDLLDDMKALLNNGSAVFAPYVRTSAKAPFVDEAVLKAGLFGGILAIQDAEVRIQTGNLHPMTRLEIPYLEDVPLAVLSEILKDEGESLGSFRKQLWRAIEDMRIAKDPSEAQRVATRFKREILEDELERVRQSLERVAKMNAVARIGAYVGTATLVVGGILGLGVPSVMVGASGVATVTLAALYKNYLEKRQLQRSPMHLVWRLKSKSR